MSETAHAAVSADGQVLTVRFTNPDRLNPVDTEVKDAVLAGLDRVEADDQLRVLVLTGTGRAFSSGADLTGADQLSASPAAAMESTSEVIRRITGSPKPVVAALNGLAAGVAAGYALAADIAIAVEDAYLLLPFTGIGLMPDGGTTLTFAASMGRSRAMRAALLGERISAADAVAAGLISEVCAADRLDDRIAQICTALVHRPAGALAATKRAINQATIGGLDAALDLERDGQVGRLADPEFVALAAAFVAGGKK
ncbi:enoyl-CoA hydratase [Flexivirga sp. ID2601S]|uniref:Enoyl-CoA hydratase n=1 Tax=Flexivirga aerilata TaxID=1656889 RepID=A0A849ALV9_9MICO|nr:enoyl-CoA hydratase-related protein [Flexivirga aerilata]NNG37792.1 enoyl-CoA hydratase [Flexivirga aerilata]